MDPIICLIYKLLHDYTVLGITDVMFIPEVHICVIVFFRLNFPFSHFKFEDNFNNQ